MGVDLWQPIETAPDDIKTLVDLWVISTRRGMGFRATDCWFTAGKKWKHFALDLDTVSDVERNDYVITHWMPITEPTTDPPVHQP